MVKKLLSISLSSLLITSTIYAADKQMTINDFKYFQDYKRKVGEKTEKVQKFVNDLDTPVEIDNKTKDIAKGKVSWSLVNEECEPEFNMSAMFKEMIGRYKEALSKVMDPKLWKMYLMNKSIEYMVDYYAKTKCMSELSALMGDPIKAQDTQAKLDDCIAERTKNVTEISNGTTTGTSNTVTFDFTVDPASLGFAAMCVKDVMGEETYNKYNECVQFEKERALKFLNGTISDALNFGMLDFQIQQQKCILDQKNYEMSVQDIVGDGYKISTKPISSIGNDSGSGGSGGSGNGAGNGTGSGKSGYKKTGQPTTRKTGSVNIIKTNNSTEDPRNSLKVMSQSYNFCNSMAIEGFKGKINNSSSFLTEEVLRKVAYPIVLHNWCSIVFDSGCNTDNIIKYTDENHDIEVLDCRWDFDDVAGVEREFLKEKGIIKTNFDTPIYKECSVIANMPMADSLFGSNAVDIIDNENGKLDGYEKVIFNNERKKNRFNYFLYVNKKILDKSKSNGFDLYKDKVRTENNYNKRLLYYMINSCIVWASNLVNEIEKEREKRMRLYSGSKVQSNGKIVSDKTYDVEQILEKEMEEIYKTRIAKLNRLLKALNDRIEIEKLNEKSFDTIKHKIYRTH